MQRAKLPSYILGSKKINWYPGHMEKSLRIISENIRKHQVGLIVEVRDSRVPLSCINWKFEHLFMDPESKQRSMQFKNEWGDEIGAPLERIKRMIVYNKTDLVDGPCNPSVSGNRVSDYDDSSWRKMITRNSKYPSQFTCASYKNSAETILTGAIKLWIDLHRDKMKETPSVPYPPLNILIIGLPNTGKSSLINSLRTHGLFSEQKGSDKSKVAETGRNPGVTQHVSSKIKVLDTQTVATGYTPVHIVNAIQSELDARSKTELAIAKALRAANVKLKVYVIDSPGILPPNFTDSETALKLSLANLVPISTDGAKGADAITVAEYLWWRIRERWSLGEQVLEAYQFPTVAIPERVIPLLKHLSTFNNKNDNDQDNYGSSRGSEQDQLCAAALKFLKDWQDGQIYKDLGLFSADVKDKAARKGLNKEVWKVAMVDDEFLEGGRVVGRWFKERYEGPVAVDDKIPVSKIDDIHNDYVKVGDLYVKAEETMNAQERKKLRKNRLKLLQTI